MSFTILSSDVSVCVSVCVACIKLRFRRFVLVRFHHFNCHLHRILWLIHTFYIQIFEMAYVVAITFTTNPRAVVIRKDWIYGYSQAKTLNNGINCNQTHSIFFSTDLEREPNFNLERRGFFEREPDATYDAKLFRFFGEYG